MGAWAEDAFGNDTACDWAGDFSDNPSIEKIEEALDLVLESEDCKRPTRPPKIIQPNLLDSPH